VDCGERIDRDFPILQEHWHTS